MKKNALFLLLFPLILTGCKGETNTTSNTNILPVDEFGRTVINEFEDINDLYKIRQIILETNRNSRSKLDISHDERFVKYGNGSLHVQYLDGDHGDLFQRINMTPNIDDKDFSDLKEVVAHVYNDNDEVKRASISIYKEEHEVLFTTNIDLQPHEWTECKLELNKVVISKTFEKFQGFAIGLPKNASGQTDSYYIDNLSIDFGALESEEDCYYLGIIDSLSARIDKLPISIDTSDTATINEIESIVNEYSKIPTIYRSLLTNYETLTGLMKKYVNQKAIEDKDKSNTTALYYDTCFGLVQASEDYTSNELDFSYSTEMHYQNERGSLAVKCSELAVASGWNSFNLTPALDWSKYTTVTFAIYADIDVDFGFCISWNKFSQIGQNGLNVQPGRKWVTYTYPAANLSKAGEQLNMTGIDALGNSVLLNGTIYLSAFIARNPTYDYLEVLLNNLPDLNELTIEHKELVDEAKAYYDGLSDEEKAKVPASVLDRLNAYVNRMNELVGAGTLEILPDLINAIPVLSSYKESQFSLIYYPYNLYSSLPENVKAKLDSDLVNKLLTAKQTFDSAYPNRGLVSLPAEDNLVGQPTWDARVKDLSLVTDNDYGYTWKFNKNNLEGMSTALEVSLENMNTSGYSKLKFWVKSSEDIACVWVANSLWANNRIDGNKFNSITKESWTEITVDVADLTNPSNVYVIFVLDQNASIQVTAVEGIK